MATNTGARASRPRSPLKLHAEWRSRGRVPHWEAGDVPQFITFRLADSLPRAVLERALSETSAEAKRARFEALLDAGAGERTLAIPRAAAIVQDALLHLDLLRYRLHAWCVMPNHVHVLATPGQDVSLSSMVHSWKSFTAHAINAELGRKGRLWAEEYFDRVMRNDEQFRTTWAYIEENPIKAGLCASPELWPYSSASRASAPADGTSALRNET
jgi:REP element-mobilizing transposase RayT